MAFPFGGYTTVGQYKEWAQRSGCTFDHGIMTDAEGSPTSYCAIHAPDGSHWVTLVGKLDSEYLTPTEIHSLDRRLKMNSPFDSWDADHGAAEDDPAVN